MRKWKAVLNAARDIENRSRPEGSFPGYAPGQVWKETHGIVTMLASSKTHYTDSDGLQHEITYGAETFGSTIEVYGSASDDPFNFKLNMVHEFAHVFNGRTVNTTDMDLTMNWELPLMKKFFRHAVLYVLVCRHILISRVQWIIRQTTNCLQTCM
ncbi:MAG: hypothetical protein M5U34_18275 [Chloroflexi bacterium]|nr:hypothetical protein [Chloroflexota bacterium]